MSSSVSICLWLSGSLALALALWLWLSGSLALWLWLSGSLALWLSGSLALALWLSGSGSASIWMSCPDPGPAHTELLPPTPSGQDPYLSQPAADDGEPSMGWERSRHLWGGCRNVAPASRREAGAGDAARRGAAPRCGEKIGRGETAARKRGNRFPQKKWEPARGSPHASARADCSGAARPPRRRSPERPHFNFRPAPRPAPRPPPRGPRGGHPPLPKNTKKKKKKKKKKNSNRGALAPPQRSRAPGGRGGSEDGREGLASPPDQPLTSTRPPTYRG